MTTHKNLRLKGLTEAYYDMQDLIRSTVWDFMRMYNIPPNQYQELESEASLLFVQAYDSYNIDRGTKLSTHVKTKMLQGLIDFKRRKGYQSVIHQIRRILNHGSINACPIKDTQKSKHTRTRNRMEMESRILRPVSHYHTNLEWLMRMLEDDGRQILVLITNRPDELEQLESAHQKERKLADYLKNRLGWSDKRIEQAFSEMRGTIE